MTNSYKPYLRVFLLALLGGGTGIFLKISLLETTPFVATFWRFCFGLLVLIPIFLSSKRQKKEYKKIPSHKRLFFIIIAGILGSLNPILFLFGIQHTTTMSGQILYTLSPILTAIFAYFIFREKLTSYTRIGLLLGCIGTVCIIFLPVFYGGDIRVGNTTGNLLILGAVFCFTLYTTFSKYIQKHISSRKIVLGFFIISMVTAGVCSIILSQDLLPSMTRKARGGIIYAGAIGTGFFYYLHQCIIKRYGATHSSLMLYIQPILVTTLAIPILGERLTILFVIGSLIALGGTYIASIKPKIT